MIFDNLSHAPGYFSGDWWTEVLAFVETAPADLPAGERLLRGHDLFVKILDFTTGPVATAVLESHRAYTDVHVVLEGAEIIRVWPAEALTVRQPYDTDKDVILYDPPPHAPTAFELRPGQFAVLQPQDAHMPALELGAPARIRKLVFKVATHLISAGHK